MFLLNFVKSKKLYNISLKSEKRSRKFVPGIEQWSEIFSGVAFKRLRLM